MSNSDRIQWENPRPWPTLRPEAYDGLIGEVIRAIEPHSEADPVALLFSAHVGLGSYAGAGPHRLMGQAIHPPRLFVAIIGRSNVGGKGDSKRDVWPFLLAVDPLFGTRVATGLHPARGWSRFSKRRRKRTSPTSRLINVSSSSKRRCREC